MATQRVRLLNYLQTGRSITPKQAREEIYLFVLAQRISDLKAEGFPIKSDWYVTENNERVKEYWLEKEFIKTLKGKKYLTRR